MSDKKKSLGQVAFEACMAIDSRRPRWDECPQVHTSWERAAQAVADALKIRTCPAKDCNVCDMCWKLAIAEGKAEGAAEMRERLAQMLEEAARVEKAKFGENELYHTNLHFAKAIRGGGGP